MSEIKCPACGAPWDTSLYNACECGATVRSAAPSEEKEEDGIPEETDQLPKDIAHWVRFKEDEYSHQKSDQDAYRQGAIDLYWEWVMKEKNPTRLSFVKFAYGCMHERDALQSQLSSITEELSKARTKCCTPKQIAERYFPAQCPGCGFKGSSSEWHGGHAIADTGDYSDPVCPVCGRLDMDEIENGEYSDQSVFLLQKVVEARSKADGYYWDLDQMRADRDAALKEVGETRNAMDKLMDTLKRQYSNDPDRDHFGWNAGIKIQNKYKKEEQNNE